MKRRMVLLTILGILLIVAGLNWYLFLFTDTSKDRTDSRRKFDYNAFPIPDGSFYAGYKFPLRVSRFKDALGMPDKTIVDDDESCPVGQVHYWCLKEKNIQVMVLGDRYEPEIDYFAGTRLYAVSRCDMASAALSGDLWDIRLGDPAAEVKKKLEALAMKDNTYKLVQNGLGSAVHCYLLCESMKHQYILSKDGMYLFFMIGENDLLETIMYSTMNVLEAC